MASTLLVCLANVKTIKYAPFPTHSPSASRQQTSVRTTVKAILKRVETAMLFRIPFSSFAPHFCPRQIPKPPVNPLIKQNTKYIIVTTPAQFVSLSAMVFVLSATCKKLDFQSVPPPYLQLESTEDSFADKPTPWRGEVCIWRHCLQTKEYGI